MKLMVSLNLLVDFLAFIGIGIVGCNWRSGAQMISLLLAHAVDDLTPQHQALRRQTTASILSYYNLSFKDTLMNH